MTTTEVWTTYHLDLKRFILSKTKDPIVADDILQDSFLRIHTKLDTLKDVTKIKSWIFAITKNTINDYFKLNSKNVPLNNKEIMFEENVQTHSEKDCLHGILKSLPKKYRNPIFLSDIKGLKQQEIADRLNLPLPTIKSQIQRARKMIASGFMDCCDYKLNDDGKLVGELKEKEECKVCN